MERPAAEGKGFGPPPKPSAGGGGQAPRVSFFPKCNGHFVKQNHSHLVQVLSTLKYTLYLYKLIKQPILLLWQPICNEETSANYYTALLLHDIVELLISWLLRSSIPRSASAHELT